MQTSLTQIVQNEIKQQSISRIQKKHLFFDINSENKNKRISLQDVIQFYVQEKYKFKLDFWIAGSIQTDQGIIHRILLVHERRFDFKHADFIQMKKYETIFETSIDFLRSDYTDIKAVIALFYEECDQSTIEKMKTQKTQYWVRDDFQSIGKLSLSLCTKGLSTQTFHQNPQLFLKDCSKIQKGVELYQNILEIEQNKQPKYIFPDLMKIKTRKRHVWIWGDSGAGKSSYILYAQKKLGVKISLGKEEGYWDSAITKPDCGTIIFDEFSGKWDVQRLNRILDGNFNGNAKYEKMVKILPIDKKKIQCIFISNKHPSIQAPKLANDVTFINRVHYIHTNKLINYGIDLKKGIQEAYDDDNNEQIPVEQSDLYNKLDFNQYKTLDDIPEQKKKYLHISIPKQISQQDKMIIIRSKFNPPKVNQNFDQ